MDRSGALGRTWAAPVRGQSVPYDPYADSQEAPAPLPGEAPHPVVAVARP